MKVVESLLAARPMFWLAFSFLVGAGTVGAQEPVAWPIEQLLQPPRVAISFPGPPNRDGDAIDGSFGSRTPRLRLSGMPSGFLSNPIGTPADDELPRFDNDGSPLNADGGDAFAAVQFNVSSYNPYFDLRHPGDPGGLGYYKLYSQLQLLDVGTTSFCLGLQAFTPAGLQSGGLANGPTYVMPALAWFQDLGEGAALQGYVGQNIQANGRWVDRLDTGFHCGMAVQYPVPGTAPVSGQGVFLFVQALGRYRFDGREDSRPLLWEFVPGVHWRMNNNCWMSLGASRYQFLNCAWQF